MSASVPKLFQPTKVGRVNLKHRVVMAPLTRYRADEQHVHTDLGVEYYSQRGSTPGTLLITEATFIAAKAGGYANVPALETDAQVVAWKKITDAVHAKGSFIFAQLWALGRQAKPDVIAKEGYDYVSSSDIQLTGRDVKPRPLTTEEVKDYVQTYAKAAANAVLRAGFDGVEIHGANGYLIDQFIQDVSNHRTDEYGGSIENRARFALEIVDAVVKEVGADRTGIRFSPWSTFADMRMKDPKPQFTYLVEKIKEKYPDLAYIHLVEGQPDAVEDSNDFIRDIWYPRPLLTAGGYDRAIGLAKAEKGDLSVYGRFFISNPDLPVRLQKDIPLTPFDHTTFYKTLSPDGYTDYPFAEVAEEKKEESSSFLSKATL